MDLIDEGQLMLFASHLLSAQLLTKSFGYLDSICDGRKGLLVALDDTISRRVHDLQNECHHQLKRCLSGEDAIHLATASAFGCKKFITQDKKRKEGNLSPIADKQGLERLLNIEIVGPADFIPSQPPEPPQPSLEFDEKDH